MSTYLDVPSVKAYLRIGTTDTLDDALLQEICDAVEAEQRARCVPGAFVTVNPLDGPPPETQIFPTPPEAIPADLYHAALMRASRLYARRASPEGLVGLGDLGVARIPAYDRDIDALEAPWRAMVIG